MIPDDTPAPVPQPGSALVPPVRPPRTALAADSSLPPGERARVWLRQTSVAHSAGDLVRYLLDAMDVLGDTVAEGLGLRKRPEERTDEPPPPAA
jgi:hypothetical protein